ncbi:acyltransferase domain-containing protein [Clostridium sp. KNHs205]|uniref:acyltransferase domain-containing protein n=1 Tax=Clostridium sp. KNHs205 TaxID=1449050 RepID=UPI00051AFEA4|nr:acyltransferase domain-containing protein [Clostridium sp. KNHs205]
MKQKYSFAECVEYCGFDNLPLGLESYYMQFDEHKWGEIIDIEFLNAALARFKVPGEKQEQLKKAIREIEADDRLAYFTKFLIWDLCNARKRYENNNYQSLTLKGGGIITRYYSLILLLACVKPSLKRLQKRKIPLAYYEQIPFVPMKQQFEKWVAGEDVSISDFPWELNFYTCSIFWLNRFQYIPCRFEQEMTVFRNKKNNGVLALLHGNIEVRRDGQINGTNEIFDNERFVTVWEEDESTIRANPVNPMGFVMKEPVLLKKAEWKTALSKGDYLLAFHIPSGPGYTAVNVKQSMELALTFYRNYFGELDIKGFLSESWLYDSRLSLILDYDNSNIIKVQRQFYLYPARDGEGMLLERVFGAKQIDLENFHCVTTLQEKVVDYMKTGGRFNELRMFVLKEEVSKIGESPYITVEDINQFIEVVDSHLLKK